MATAGDRRVAGPQDRRGHRPHPPHRRDRPRPAGRAEQAGAQAALVAVKDHQHGESKTNRKLAALGRRIRDRLDDYLRFAVDLRSPFDNNAAEQQIRMVKIRPKVSGCLRTLDGAQRFALIRSYLATAAAHGRNLLEALTELAAGHPWLPTAEPNT